jgi:lipid II:glycine glycyltransferase (peptidoglycan interpeptide bridge formation enzyme)
MYLMNRSGYQVEVDSVTESDWCELLDRFEDANIYQTWSYGSVRWGTKSLSHLVLKRDGEALGIAQLRIVRPRNFRLGIAYLRWGPLCHLRTQELDPNIVHAMATALRKEFVEKRGLYLEILPNAFSDSPRAEMFRSAFSRFDHQSGISGEKYRTFVLDLLPSIEEIRKKLDKKWRNQLNAAERNDLRIIEGDSVGEYDIFNKLYTQMWERKRFETTVSTEEFRRIQEHLPTNQRMRILICVHKEQPVAGLVCSAIGDSAIYLLGATNENGMKLKAAYMLHWAMIQSLKDRRIRYYDLGGIDPIANPGVHHFKSGFNGADVSHISPFVACDNRFSAAFVKAGQVVRGGLRRFQLHFAHA